MRQVFARRRNSLVDRGLVALLAVVMIPAVMCGESTAVVRQGGVGGSGGGPGNGPGSVKWSTCSTGDCLIYEHVTTTALGAGGSATATATCPADERMLSGGYAIEHASADTRVIEDYPSDTGSWTVTALNNSDGDATLSADVNCVRVDKASAQTALPAPTTATIAAGGSGSVSATCPSGLVPTGGGFRLALAGSARVGGAVGLAGALPGTALSGTLGASIITSQPQLGGWQVAASATANPVAASAYVVCWNATHWSTLSSDASVPAGGSAQATANMFSCPSGSTLTGGGFTISDVAAYGTLQVQSSGDNIDGAVLDHWAAVASNTDTSAAHSLSAIGVCAV